MLTELVGPVAAGDRVVVNTTAVDLGLGTGGWDVVHWNLSRDSWEQAGHGHVMKLRYTSLQTDVGAAEEAVAADQPAGLEGMPVVACGLHSQLPCVAAVIKHLAPTAHLVYVMTDGAALPLALSDLVAGMRQAALVDATVTVGNAFGGDYEAVNVHSALHLARVVAGADAVVAAPGPGVVGTGTALGFGPLEMAAVLDAAAAFGAHPIAAVRYSEAEPRPRHRHVSHHTRTALALAHSRPAAAVPTGHHHPLEGADVVEVDVPDVPALLEACGLSVTSMGRGSDQDPAFYAYAGAAGAAAAAWISSRP